MFNVSAYVFISDIFTTAYFLFTILFTFLL